MEVFFECTSWDGKLENKEPHKCEGFSFFSTKSLPENTIPYIAAAIQAADQGQFYSEDGWRA
jgi:hypothetical protein